MSQKIPPTRSSPRYDQLSEWRTTVSTHVYRGGVVGRRALVEGLRSPGINR